MKPVDHLPPVCDCWDCYRWHYWDGQRWRASSYTATNEDEGASLILDPEVRMEMGDGPRFLAWECTTLEVVELHPEPLTLAAALRWIYHTGPWIIFGLLLLFIAATCIPK